MSEEIRRPTADYEQAKFSDTGLVKSTGFSGPIVEIDYDANDNPIEIREYTARREVTLIKNIAPDVSGSLNNKYFEIYSAGDATAYYVWLNVGGAGTDPAIGGKTGIEVAVSTNATATDIRDACVLEINTNHNTDFLARETGSSSFRIEVTDFLATTQSSDGDTGFSVIRKRAGTEKILKIKTNITYDANQNATNIKRQEYT